MNMIEQIEEMRELLNKYPKTKQLLLEWMTVKVQEMQKMSLPKEQEVEIPPINPEDVEIMLLGQMAFSPRFLYEFFDIQKAFISIDCGMELFYFAVNGEKSAPSYASRAEAERNAFLQAFEICEKQLA